MTDRFPLILDSGDNRIKELPSGDNLDLEGSQIVNAVAISAGSISTTGTIQASSITVNGSNLATVALTNSYTDLDNLPAGFSGSYNDLIDTPNIPSTSRDLDDVINQEPVNGDALLYNSTEGLYEPGAVLTELDLSNSNIGDLNNVLITGTVTNKYLKFSAGAWRPSFVQYSEVKDKPTNVSFFANDAGYITADAIQEIQGDFQGSVFADDSTLLVDGVNGTVPGTLTGNWNNPDNSFIVQGEGIGIYTGSTNLLVSDSGINFYNSANSENISLQVGNGGIGLSGSGSATFALGGAVTAATGAISWSVNGTVSWAVNGAVNLAADNINIGPGGVDADLTGSVFADDSTLLVDGVAGSIPYSVISDVQVVEDDLQVDFGAIVATQIQTNGLPINTRFIQDAPVTSRGEDGDLAGAVTFDSQYVYFCTADFDGVTDIWRRTPWAESSW